MSLSDYRDVERVRGFRDIAMTRYVLDMTIIAAIRINNPMWFSQGSVRNATTG